MTFEMEGEKLMANAVYIHIPFCQHICNYCDFCKVFYQAEFANLYLEQLQQEILTTYQNEEISTIYIGGGTPSCLSVPQLKRLFSILSIFKLSNDAEICMEANFDSLDEEKIKYLSKKIHRISLGVETICPRLQSIIGRKQDPKDITHTIGLLKEYGLNNINVDLIYGLPTQTISDLVLDLDFILSLDVCHISLYSLILEEHTKLYLEKTKPISEELDLKMYQLIEKTLTAHGFIHYEISNYAKPYCASKHNLIYWKNQHYYGFGVGAASYLGNKRMTNSRSFTAYLDGKMTKEIESLTKEDELEYEIMLAFRLQEGLDKKAFEKRFSHPLSFYYAYEPLVKQQILQEDATFLRVHPSYWYVLNEVIVAFLKLQTNV